MEEEKIDIKLVLIIFFLGWFGIDKFYALKGKGLKLFAIKFLANFIGIGEIWNIIDFVMALCKNYRADPREYLDLIEKKNKR
jgi:TM2 domain-containing membrane protein YozV